MNKDNLSSVGERIFSSTTPPFWKKVRRIALVITAVTGVIATAPVSLPAAIVTASAYLATIGATLIAASSAATDDK